MIASKQALAMAGYSAGGRPPFGFARFLKYPNGTTMRLEDGMRVRQEGCHVVHLPDDQQKIAIWISILEMKYEGKGLAAIAKKLNERGIPSPDVGRTRTDQGVKHRVSGKWNASTVSELCRNPIIVGQLEYGKRSEGKLLRHTKTGSRPLRDDERRGKNAFVRATNPKEERVSVVAGFDPLYPMDRWQAIQAQMDGRAKSQAGISKHPDPGKYPLSTRIVDMTEGCGSIMYAFPQQTQKNNQSCTKPVYKCGRYVKQRECYHNAVDGEILLKVVLRSLKHAVTSSGERNKLTAKLFELASKTDNGAEERGETIDRLEAQVNVLESEMSEIARKLAIETDQRLSTEFRSVYTARGDQLAGLKLRMSHLIRADNAHPLSPKDRVKRALQLLDQLEILATAPDKRAKINALLQKLEIWVGLDFAEGKFGKRPVRRLRSGMLCIGKYDLPVPLHGRDNCDETKHAGDCGCSTGPTLAIGEKPSLTPGGEDGKITDNRAETDDEKISYTKVSRGDMIRTCDFLLPKQAL